jgi:hypothetical protein
MLKIPELLKIIFENRQPFWRAEFEQWVRASRRFRAFAETYSDKIRKKLRLAQDDATLKDLYSELETAYRLLQDERFTLEYEKLALKQRAPDFAVTYRVNTIFNVEVTRLRFPTDSVAAGHEEIERVSNRKLLDLVCDKLGQMLPATINILLIIPEWEITSHRLLATMNELRLSAELKNDTFFVRRGFQDARDFLKSFQRLSAIFCQSGENKASVLWLNPLARHAIPKELLNALQKL